MENDCHAAAEGENCLNISTFSLHCERWWIIIFFLLIKCRRKCVGYKINVRNDRRRRAQLISERKPFERAFERRAKSGRAHEIHAFWVHKQSCSTYNEMWPCEWRNVDHLIWDLCEVRGSYRSIEHVPYPYLSYTIKLSSHRQQFSFIIKFSVLIRWFGRQPPDRCCSASK